MLWKTKKWRKCAQDSPSPKAVSRIKILRNEVILDSPHQKKNPYWARGFGISHCIEEELTQRVTGTVAVAMPNSFPLEGAPRAQSSYLERAFASLNSSKACRPGWHFSSQSEKREQNSWGLLGAEATVGVRRLLVTIRLCYSRLRFKPQYVGHLGGKCWIRLKDMGWNKKHFRFLLARAKPVYAASHLLP